MNITKGKIPTALKVVVYGPEGIGKSTFASQFPGAVFIDTEGSTTHMDVARFDKPEKWMDIHEAVDWTIAHPDQVGTLVIDTADWAEKLATRYVCKEEVIDPKGNTRGWDNIEVPGYGKGYVALKNAFQVLLDKLSQLPPLGVNVVITAHAILKKFEQPDEMGAYDRWALKLNEKNVAPIVKEWADMVLFANYKTDVVKAADGKTNKARGGQKRIMYTQHSACWDAKNRFGLDDMLPFDFAEISHLIPFKDDIAKAPAPVPEVHAEPDPRPEITPPKAEVTTQPTLPPEIVNPAAAKRKKNDAPPKRPESMQSENPEKDAARGQLWGLMVKGGVPDPLALMTVVANKDYYDMSVKIRDYDIDFITDVLIEAWEQVLPLCQTIYNKLPF